MLFDLFEIIKNTKRIIVINILYYSLVLSQKSFKKEKKQTNFCFSFFEYKEQKNNVV